jgi:uncharacterized protein YndB with AHSA1/START domain
MQVEAEITIDRPVQEVFDYLARGEHLPEYAAEFASVRQTSGGPPAQGTQYRYATSRGAEGTFRWSRFEPPSHLAWEGPPVKAGPGSMQPAGRWELSRSGAGTQVRFVMAPTPGGVFKVLAPFLAAGMRRANSAALERLKQRLEAGPGACA